MHLELFRAVAMLSNLMSLWWAGIGPHKPSVPIFTIFFFMVQHGSSLQSSDAFRNCTLYCWYGCHDFFSIRSSDNFNLVLVLFLISVIGHFLFLAFDVEWCLSIRSCQDISGVLGFCVTGNLPKPVILCCNACRELCTVSSLQECQPWMSRIILFLVKSDVDFFNMETTLETDCTGNFFIYVNKYILVHCYLQVWILNYYSICNCRFPCYLNKSDWSVISYYTLYAT